MFYIVESEEQLYTLDSFKDEKCYIEVISSNNNYHPKLVHTVAVYLRPVSHHKGYIIPISHSEGLNVAKDRVSAILRTFQTLYTLDKKNLLYHFRLPEAIDINILNTLLNFTKIEEGSTTSTYSWYYNRFPEHRRLNSIIPIAKLYEDCENRYEQVKQFLEVELPQGFDFYNKTATSVFYLIEQSGIRVIEKPFIELFKPQNPIFNIQDNIVYTSYNLNNITSRPTNAFNSVNFAAIPKAPEFRKAIIPKNDYFIEYDYDGYHIRLLCEQIGYELTEEPAHRQLAKLYYRKEEITDEEYQKAKQTNFHAIYGKIPPEYAFLEVFDKIQTYIDRLWKQFKEQGYVEDPISGRRFTQDLPDMHPQKLMNYMMQSIETSRNTLVSKELLKYLQGKKTTIALYTYDALLLDFKEDDGKHILQDIDQIISQNNKYPTNVKVGRSLNLERR